jgi:hypothetical protein
MNSEIRKSLELRQQNLISLLKNQKETLELEKQHQIYGAIKEIDYILRMLKVQEEEHAEILKTIGSDETYDIVKVEEKTRRFKMPFSLKFDKNEP